MQRPSRIPKAGAERYVEMTKKKLETSYERRMKAETKRRRNEKEDTRRSDEKEREYFNRTGEYRQGPG